MWISLVVIFITISIFADNAAAYCMQGSLHSEITETTKRVRKYCEYRSPDGATVLRLFPGSKIYTTDCQECDCDLTYGLSCCGFGSHAGVVGLPDDCTKLQDGCQDLFVKKNDTSIHCFTGQPINFQRMVNTVHPDTYIGTAKAPGEKEKAKSSVGQAPQLSSREALFVPLPKIEIPKFIQFPSTRTGSQLTPRLDLTKLNLQRPISEILHALMTKQFPAAANSVKDAGIGETIPSVAQTLQANVENLRGSTQGSWRPPMSLQTFYDMPPASPYLPWLFMDHI